MSEPRLQAQINKKSVEYENHEEQWSESERAQLISLWERNLSLVDITENLKRPKHQIIHALFELEQIILNEKYEIIIQNYYSNKVNL
jgi:hypothetical protein